MTRLITAADDKQVWTATRETDTHSALTQGLAEYLELQSIVFNGKEYGFTKVFDHWADPEDESNYPSAAVYALSPGIYDASSFTPRVNRKDRLSLPDGRFIMTSCEFQLEMKIEIWATKDEERKALCSMVEDALDPVEWRYGPLLELTHYFGARASYESLGMSHDDASDEAMRHHRKASFRVIGHVPKVKLISLPTFPDQKPVRLKNIVVETGLLDP